MEESRINILGVGIDALTENEAVERAFALCRCRRREAAVAVTPNPVIIMNARRDEVLSEAVAKAELSLGDGVGVVSAARRLGTPLPMRVTGIDTAIALFERLDAASGSIFLLGAREGVALGAAQRLEMTYPHLRVVGTADGYFADGSEREREILKSIEAASPDLLVLCLGSPRQEIWAHSHRGELSSVGLVFCLGGVLDVLGGRIRRAPRVFIRLHLEWLWRMLREPKRFAAIPTLVRFRLLTGAKGRKEGKSGARNKVK